MYPYLQWLTSPISYGFSDAIDVSVSVSREKRNICLQETVTFTCTVQNGRGLVWRAEPFISEENEIAFIPNSPVKNITFTSRGVIFQAVLTQSDPVLQSTLSITASATTNGTVMECIEPFTKISDNSTLQLQGKLPPPMKIITLGPCIHWVRSFFSQS